MNRADRSHESDAAIEREVAEAAEYEERLADRRYAGWLAGWLCVAGVQVCSAVSEI